MTEPAAVPTFHDLFGCAPTVRAKAPGRVNLIGEHTDYNEGFVLPVATPQHTDVALRCRTDNIVRVWSANVAEEERHLEFAIGSETRRGRWDDYVAGVTASLREHGHLVGGFDVRIESALPLGGGLSSSASLEVALLRGLNDAYALGLDAMAIARIAHDAETGLVGAPVGVMDQMAASLAEVTRALFIDTRTLEFERLPLPPGSAIIVIYSGVSHRHSGGEYRLRRAECERAARLLDVTALRDVPFERLGSIALPAPLDRRVRHVVSENARVLKAREALTRADPTAFGALMYESHNSLRDDFEVSIPEIDLLVDLAQAQDEVFGARMTGGGFGGSIVALCELGKTQGVARRLALAYRLNVSRHPVVLIA